MANSDSRFGLTPVRYRSGAPYNGACNPYAIASNYGTALYIGDVVTRTGTANAAAITAVGAGTFPIGSLPEVEKTTAGDSSTDAERQTGVIVGFAASPSAGLDKQYNPASTARVAYVADDPNLVFEVQCPSALTAAQIGLNAILLYTHGGSTVTGISGVEIDGGDGTAPAADASYQVRIIGQVNRPDNEPNAVYNKVYVVLNNHTEAHGMVDNAHGTLGI
jgi:hypothetical protein